MTRTQRQRATRGGLYLVFVALVVGLVTVADWEVVGQQFFDVDVIRGMFPEVLTIAAKNTVIFTAVTFAVGLVAGLGLALMKLSPVAPYRIVATVYIEIFRGLPALLTIFLFAFGVPIAFRWQAPGGVSGAAVIGLTVVAAAYMAETIRAGIEAVPKGQIEAARSLGMSPLWAMISIVLPQAFRIVIPPLTNELVLIIKDTSLIAFAGATFASRELTGYARNELFNVGNPTPLIVAGAFYIAITVPMTQLVRVLEKRNARAR